MRTAIQPYDEVAFALENAGVAPREIGERIKGVLESLGVWHLRERGLHTLSGGERQKVAVAAALVMKPTILALDETTRGLDAHAKRELGLLLKKLASKGTAVLLVTHDVELVATIADRLAVVKDGMTSPMAAPHPILQIHPTFCP